MTDLERLIRHKQDTLRGRPEDWIDRFGERRRNIDWPIVVVAIGVAVPLLVVVAMLVLQ